MQKRSVGVTLPCVQLHLLAIQGSPNKLAYKLSLESVCMSFVELVGTKSITSMTCKLMVPYVNNAFRQGSATDVDGQRISW